MNKRNSFDIRRLVGTFSLCVLCMAPTGCDEPRVAPAAPIVAPAVQLSADRSPEQRAVSNVKVFVDSQVALLVDAAVELCDAAPLPDADGWAGDDAARTAMRSAWNRARDAYERIEGAVAILFPDLDLTVDGRYEHTVELTRDTDAYDGVGFVGMHAIERVLWSDAITSDVEGFERELHGYWVPAAPETAAEATRFRTGLCERLVRDVTTMQRQLEPLALDHQTAWRGVQGSIEEQTEKVLLHATGQDESRYAQRTLADMRANLAGGRAVVAAYAPMLEAHPESASAMRAVHIHFDALEAAYGQTGDALPSVPDGFDPDGPAPEHLATPYGRLFTLLSSASDPLAVGSLAARLREAGDTMDIAPMVRTR